MGGEVGSESEQILTPKPRLRLEGLFGRRDQVKPTPNPPFMLC